MLEHQLFAFQFQTIYAGLLPISIYVSIIWFWAQKSYIRIQRPKLPFSDRYTLIVLESQDQVMSFADHFVLILKCSFWPNCGSFWSTLIRYLGQLKAMLVITAHALKHVSLITYKDFILAIFSIWSIPAKSVHCMSKPVVNKRKA